MTTKSIVEIEIKDEAFKRFQTAFNDYNKALKNMPEEWRRGNREATATGKAIFVIGQQIKKVQDSTKATADNMEKFHHATVAAGHAFTSLSRTSASVAKNVSGATESLIKMAGITGVVGSLLGGAGLWGIGRLAENASNLRYSSMGVGSSPGGYNAANIQLSSILGEGGGARLLTAINRGMSNASMGWTFGGIQTGGKSPEQVIGPLILEAQKLAKATPQNQLENIFQAHGLDNYFDLEQATLLKRMSPTETQETINRYSASRNRLDIDDPVLKREQDLHKQFQESANRINRTFTILLEKLSPGIEKLSESLASAIDKFFTSGRFDKAFHSVIDGMESLTKWLSGGGLGDAFDSASGMIWSFARAAQKVIGFLFPGAEISLKGSQYRDIESSFGPMAGQIEDWLENPSAHKNGVQGIELDKKIWSAVQENPALAAKFKQYGFNVPSDDPSLLGQYTRWIRGKEKSISSFVNNPGGIMIPGSLTKFKSYENEAAGIRDLYRLLRSKTYKGRDSIVDIINEYEGGEIGNPQGNDINAYIRDVVLQTKFNAFETLDKNNSNDMSKLISAITRHEGVHPMSPSQVKLIIENNTGGNAITNAAQVAH